MPDQFAVTSTVASVEELEPFDGEYVYDIGVASGHPYFFANGILVHNSAYFSAYDVLKDEPEFQNFEWSRENVVELYDQVADAVNESFPEFMDRTFNCGLRRGAYIKAGRELVGTALFIKKKKYAILMYDKEGKRLDVDGKPGKLKPMGIDLKRADTPKVMQQFLEKLLMSLLTHAPQEEMFESIRQFRAEFKARPSWEKGSPKKVSSLTTHQAKVRQEAAADIWGMVKPKAKKGSGTVPGHVLASINWNTLRREFDDRYSMEITDGMRIVVCKLRKNDWGMTSIAYPVDEPHLPGWFKALSFDDAAMEATIVDAKLLNLVGVLEWDLSQTRPLGGSDVFRACTASCEDSEGILDEDDDLC